jgi:hypothetical protein
MGDLFSPKVKVPEATPAEKNAAAAADAERLTAIQDEAQKRTEQLMRLFGTQSLVGFGSGTF